MLQEQQSIVNNLKEIKNNVKIDLQDCEREYHRMKKQHAGKIDKYFHTIDPTFESHNKKKVSYYQNKDDYQYGTPQQNYKASMFNSKLSDI